jgi:tetratricopeptide (TPR) repeat protein
MGKKSDRKREHILFYCACLLIILFSIAGCAATASHQKKSDGHKFFESAESLMIKGDYEGAFKEYEEVLRLFPSASPADAAIFQMGLIWLYADNPQKDYKKGLEYLQRLEKAFPQSSLTGQTKVLINFINEVILDNGKITEQEVAINELKKQIVSLNEMGIKSEERNKDFEETLKTLKKQIALSRDAEINAGEKNKELEEAVKALKKQINDMKEIDLRIEEKKREDLSGKR